MSDEYRVQRKKPHPNVIICSDATSATDISPFTGPLALQSPQPFIHPPAHPLTRTPHSLSTSSRPALVLAPINYPVMMCPPYLALLPLRSPPHPPSSPDYQQVQIFIIIRSVFLCTLPCLLADETTIYRCKVSRGALSKQM